MKNILTSYLAKGLYYLSPEDSFNTTTTGANVNWTTNFSSILKVIFWIVFAITSSLLIGNIC